MKVLLINGSPHEKGCTYTALSEVAGSLAKNSIETEIYQIGSGPVYGCSACRTCRETNSCVCVLDGDCANELAEKMLAADGVIIGSPVYYAGPNGALCALLDRAFFSRTKEMFAYKPAAAVVSCRRAGSTAA
ncbi:MAG: flavodoxin family protein, partial [Oscillospiraceae bacterium]|nr:flavodoxin family protein [Oscillospiraceae bacterium]